MAVCFQGTRWSALMLAAINNQKKVAQLLLQAGAEREHRDISKRTAAQLASVMGHREVEQVLTGEKVGESSCQ